MNLLKPGTQKRLNELIGFLWMVVAILIALSLLSYSPEDPSLNTAGIITLPSASGGGMNNWVGVAGSYLADLLLQVLGYVSFLIPVVLAWHGWKWFRSQPVESPRQKMAGFLLLFFSLSSLLGLISAIPKTHGVFPPGGLLGVLISSGIVSILNVPGAFVVTLACVVTGTFLATPFTFSGSAAWAKEQLPSREGFSFRLSLPNFSNPFRMPTARVVVRPTSRRPFEPKPRILAKSLPAPAVDISPMQEYPNAIKPLEMNQAEAKPSKMSKVLSMISLGRKNRRKETTEAAKPIKPMEPIRAKSKAPSKEEPKRTKAASKPKNFAPISGSRYRLPSTSLLKIPEHLAPPNEAELQARAEALVEKMEEFAISGEVVQINPGPVVTTFEFRPEAGIKLSRITNLGEDLCLALRAESILIERIPGKSTVGIEVPNDHRDTIMLREIVESREYAAAESKITLPLGKDLTGHVTVADLATMPHILVAGATGTGKSVAINSFIVSMLYKATPDDVKLILIDPKRLELGLYEGIPHLYTPIVTEPKVASNVLRNAVKEMEHRLKLLAKYGVRNLAQFNKLFEDEDTAPGLNEDGEEFTPLPYMVIIIDELADLMMIETNNVETSITRLAQMARAVGIHLVLATQRPSVDVITGLIKANFPARISFRVATRTDSRTIIDANGAESLLGKGDMLYLPAGSSRLHRIHGPLVTEKETVAICDFWRKQGDPVLNEEFLKAPRDPNRPGGKNYDPSDEDELYQEAVDTVVELGKASTSTLQRRLRIGYGRAARLIDMMEQQGIVGPPLGSKAREVLYRKDRVEMSTTL